jgi:group I intron endonuclease
MGWIYRLVFPNGKSYVGQTRRVKVTDRWRAHKTRANSKTTKRDWPVYRAINKFGWKNVKCIVVCKVDNQPLDEVEKATIEKFDSYHNGYNLTPGGDKNPMNTESVRAKLSATCSHPDHKAAVSKRIMALHSDAKWREEWLSKHQEAHRTLEHREGQSKRSIDTWKADKIAGKNRGTAIREGLKNMDAAKKAAQIAKGIETKMKKREAMLSKLTPRQRVAKERKLEKLQAKRNAQKLKTHLDRSTRLPAGIYDPHSPSVTYSVNMDWD